MEEEVKAKEEVVWCPDVDEEDEDEGTCCS